VHGIARDHRLMRIKMVGGRARRPRAGPLLRIWGPANGRRDQRFIPIVGSPVAAFSHSARFASSPIEA